MRSGKPVIATDVGGPKDYLVDGQVGYQETPVFGMPWPHYHGRMTWAEPNLMEARERVRGALRNAGFVHPPRGRRVLRLRLSKRPASGRKAVAQYDGRDGA